MTEEKLLAALKRAIEENEKSLYVLNKKRYGEMEEAFHTLRELLLSNDPQAKVDMELRPGFKNIGDVSFETSDICIQTFQMDAFKRVMQLADNFEVHPLLNGRVEGSLAFLNIMHKKT